MNQLARDIGRFQKEKAAFEAESRQMAALFLASGIDLSAALSASPEEKRRIAARIERLIERERLKGSRRHWSYDLNRHIALKQALDRVRSTLPK